MTKQEIDNQVTASLYTVREQCLSDDPADIGSALKSFQTWEEARKYTEKLWEDGIKSYVSTINL